MSGGSGSGGIHNEHPKVEDISALTEGILPADRTAELQTHLQTCSDCAQIQDSLEEVRGLLGQCPDPAPMPAEIAASINAALAAEALLAGAAPAGRPSPGTVPTATEPVTAPSGTAPSPAEQSSEKPSASRDTIPASFETASQRSETAPASVDEAPAPPGSPGAATARTGPARSRRSSSSGPTRGGSPGRPRGVGSRQRRRRPLAVLLATACGAGVLGLGGFLVSALGPFSSTGANESSTAATAEHTTPAAPLYTESNLAPRVEELLNRSAADAGASSHSETPGRPDAEEPEGQGQQERKSPPEGQYRSPLIAPRQQDTTASSPAQLPLCVLAATGRPGEQPLATDRGQYRGSPVGVIVLPEPGSEDQVTVFLVDSSCETASPEEPGAVLLKHTLPRP